MRLSTVASSELIQVTCINFPAEAQELLIRSHRFSDHREFQSVLEKEDFDAFWSFPSLTSQESDSLLLLDMLSFFFFFMERKACFISDVGNWWGGDYMQKQHSHL